MIHANARLTEMCQVVQATTAAALTSTAGDGAYVSLENYQRLTVIINITNGSTVTGTAITLKQATAVAGTNEKALSFTRMLANTDVAANGAAFTETAVTNNTFTSSTTNSKRLCYILDVSADDLDVANGFDCVRVDADSAVNSVGSITYVLSGPRYSGANALVD